MDKETQEILKFLAKFKGHELNFDGDSAQIFGCEYAIYTEDEANEACIEYIKEHLWAFNAEFIGNFLGFDSGAIDALRSTQVNLCESCNNDLIRAMIGHRLYDFIDVAIEVDGRGHFLSSYDGHEIELDGDMFAYREN